MSRNQNETAGVDAVATPDEAPVGRMRLLPTVSFGARAASMIRVALPVAVLTAGIMAGPAANAENLVPMDTTCCPPSQS